MPSTSRNLIIAAHNIHDHIVHFYQLSALDWGTSPPHCRPNRKKRRTYSRGIDLSLNSADELAKVRDKIRAPVASGRLAFLPRLLGPRR